MRTVAATVIAALGLAALPASASAASHPVVHNFSVPGVPGVRAWGSYSRHGGDVTITLCVKDSSPKVSLAVVIGIALNTSFTRHQDITAMARGAGKQTCHTVTTPDAARLSVLASSVGRHGASQVGRLKLIY